MFLIVALAHPSSQDIPKWVRSMLINEELTLKKLEVFLAFMRTGKRARADAQSPAIFSRTRLRSCSALSNNCASNASSSSI